MIVKEKGMNFWERNQRTDNQNNKNRQSNQSNQNNNHDNMQKEAPYTAQSQNTNFNVYEHISRLSGMSEDERLGELARTASGMKQNGSLDPQDLERVYQTAGMFMNGEQLSRLRTLIDMLKR